MARQNTHEVDMRVGYHIFIQPDDDADEKWLDLGEIDSVSHNKTDQSLQLYDERGGNRLKVVDEVTQYDETYNVQLRNYDPAIFRLFMGAGLPGTFSQTATAVSSRNYTAHLGRQIMLLEGDAGTARVYDVGSVTVTGPSATPTYTAGVDYILDAKKGFMHIPTNSSIPNDTTVEISYTPAALSAKDMILPQTNIAGVNANCEIWEEGEGGNKRVVRDGLRVRVRPGGNREVGLTKDNLYELVLAVIADPTSATPAGRIVQHAV